MLGLQVFRGLGILNALLGCCDSNVDERVFYDWLRWF